MMGRKARSPEKKKAVSEDQEGCGQSSQLISPDYGGSINYCASRGFSPKWPLFLD